MNMLAIQAEAACPLGDNPRFATETGRICLFCAAAYLAAFGLILAGALL